MKNTRSEHMFVDKVDGGTARGDKDISFGSIGFQDYQLTILSGSVYTRSYQAFLISSLEILSSLKILETLLSVGSVV